MKVIINLGKGNINSGCSHIVVQLLDSKNGYQRQLVGSLPPNPELVQLHQQWQFGYGAFYQEKATRIGLLQAEGSRYSEADFKQISQQIPQKLNDWLNSDRFAPIERALRTSLKPNQPIQIIITSKEQQLQQLPWHLWHLLSDYSQAEITFSSPSWQTIEQNSRKRQKTRILVVLGSSTGLNLQEDIKSLVSLPQTELTIKTEPQLSELNEYLWQEKGWDILLFSGHSHSDLAAGYIYLNQTEKITIPQLKHSLSKAISFGLQIAIFNSCEGIGLARQLADLSIPYTVVMGEPVPDKIAQIFLQYFLSAFAQGKTFTLAVKEARQKLAGWENEFICASWLPMIWQNPTIDDIIWQDLQPTPKQKNSFRKTKIALLSSLAVSSLVIAMRSLSWLEPLELWAYDSLMQQRSPETIDPRIVVVEITEEDTNSDRYPLSDSTLVKAIDLLNQHQPAAIGLDIHRPYSRGIEYEDLIQRLQTNSHIFPVCAYSSANESYAPPSGLSPEKLEQQMGFSDLLIDDYKSYTTSSYTINSRFDLAAPNSSNIQTPKVRRQLLSYDPSLAASASKCLTPYSLSFQLAYEYLLQAEIQPLEVNQNKQWQFGEVVLQELEKKFGAYQSLNSKSSQIMINYRSGEPGKRITLDRVLSGAIEPQLIKDRIILIGYSASIARDYFDTPYGTMPGVWIHAHQTSQIISAVVDGRSLITSLPQWVHWLWIVSFSLLVAIVLVNLTEKPLIYSLLSCLVLGILLNRICLFFLAQGLWLSYVPALLSLLMVTVLIALIQRNNQPQIKSKFLNSY